MLFRDTLWDLYSTFYLALLQKGVIWGPLQNYMGSKMAPQIDQMALTR